MVTTASCAEVCWNDQECTRVGHNLGTTSVTNINGDGRLACGPRACDIRCQTPTRNAAGADATAPGHSSRRSSRGCESLAMSKGRPGSQSIVMPTVEPSACPSSHGSWWSRPSRYTGGMPSRMRECPGTAEPSSKHSTRPISQPSAQSSRSVKRPSAPDRRNSGQVGTYDGRLAESQRSVSSCRRAACGTPAGAARQVLSNCRPATDPDRVSRA